MKYSGSSVSWRTKTRKLQTRRRPPKVKKKKKIKNHVYIYLYIDIAMSYVGFWACTVLPGALVFTHYSKFQQGIFFFFLNIACPRFKLPRRIIIMIVIILSNVSAEPVFRRQLCFFKNFFFSSFINTVYNILHTDNVIAISACTGNLSRACSRITRSDYREPARVGILLRSINRVFLSAIMVSANIRKTKRRMQRL